MPPPQPSSDGPHFKEPPRGRGSRRGSIGARPVMPAAPPHLPQERSASLHVNLPQHIGDTAVEPSPTTPAEEPVKKEDEDMKKDE